MLCSDQSGRKLSPVFISSGRAQPASPLCTAANWAPLVVQIKKRKNK